MKEKTIWIWWWVGPMAGVDFHKKIIQNTSPDGGDNWHVNVVHLSYSGDIADRTAFLLDQNLENPAEGMFRKLKKIYKMIDGSNEELVFWVPCNTFHAPIIFNRFLKLIEEHHLEVEVLHMIDEIGRYVSTRYPDVENIGLMSTNWTRESRIYHDILEPAWFNIVEVSSSAQKELHDTIYNPEWWIKAISPVTSKAKNNFMKYAKKLKWEGAEAIILGCTEIPLALKEKLLNDIPLIDWTYVFARALVQSANPDKLID